MKKLGFTLSELLITLTVVGVVSALAIPTFISESQKRIQAAALSTAVTNFETAMRTMLETEDVPTVFQTRAWSILPAMGLKTGTDADIIKRFTGIFGEYLTITGETLPGVIYNNNPITQINSNNSAQVASVGVRASRVFPSNGIYYMLFLDKNMDADNHITESDALAAGLNLTDRAGTVIIDVNGLERPNKPGRDIFYFVLGSDGVLYPYGSKDVEYNFARSMNNNAGINANNDWSSVDARYSCATVRGNLSVNTDGMGCTARLIENGYRMDY